MKTFQEWLEAQWAAQGTPHVEDARAAWEAGYEAGIDACPPTSGS